MEAKSALIAEAIVQAISALDDVEVGDAKIMEDVIRAILEAEMKPVAPAVAVVRVPEGVKASGSRPCAGITSKQLPCGRTTKDSSGLCKTHRDIKEGVAKPVCKGTSKTTNLPCKSTVALSKDGFCNRHRPAPQPAVVVENPEEPAPAKNE